MVFLKSCDIRLKSIDSFDELSFFGFGLSLQFFDLFILATQGLFQSFYPAALLFPQKIEFHLEALNNIILFVGRLIEFCLQIFNSILQSPVFLDRNFKAAGYLTVFALIILHGGEFFTFFTKLSVTFDLFLKAFFVGTMEKGEILNLDKKTDTLMRCSLSLLRQSSSISRSEPSYFSSWLKFQQSMSKSQSSASSLSATNFSCFSVISTKFYQQLYRKSEYYYYHAKSTSVWLIAFSSTKKDIRLYCIEGCRQTTVLYSKTTVELFVVCSIVIIEEYQRRMSVTISNCDEICRSPTNNSPSKMLYSFPKTARFNSRRVILCDRYYDLPSTVVSCRTTSLGFGHKYDFTQDAPKNPPPNTYSIRSEFSPSKTQGFGFGKGREEMQATGPLASVKVNKNPGPGSYKMGSTLSKSAFSLNGKPHEEDKEKIKMPGPGTYPVAFCINQKGNYFLSKYKNSCVRDFSKVGGRAGLHQNKVPGPGSYDTSHVDLSPIGKYAVSKMRNCLTRKFAITTRKPIAENNENPGPGNYIVPSEFGHYIARSALEERKSFQKAQKSSKTEETHSDA